MKDVLSNWGRAYAAGMAGATALTAVHQVASRVFEDAPRMDVVGERGIARGVEAAGGTPPERLRPERGAQSPSERERGWGPASTEKARSLHRLALAGDLFANSAYYSLVACGSRAHVWRRGVVLGLAAGAGALALPRHMGLGDPPRSDRVANQIMTVAWYLVGGLAAAAFASRLSDPQQDAAHPAAA